LIFVAAAQPIGLKFGHDAWIVPEGDNKHIHVIYFCSFLIKNKTTAIIGDSHYTLAAILSINNIFLCSE